VNVVCFAANNALIKEVDGCRSWSTVFVRDNIADARPEVVTYFILL